MLSPPVYTYLQEKKKEGLLPDFLWSLVALASLMQLSLLKPHTLPLASAAYQEIRVAHLVQPMYAKLREHGAPVQEPRLVRKGEICPITNARRLPPLRSQIRRKPRDLQFSFGWGPPRAAVKNSNGYRKRYAPGTGRI